MIEIILGLGLPLPATIVVIMVVQSGNAAASACAGFVLAWLLSLSYRLVMLGLRDLDRPAR